MSRKPHDPTTPRTPAAPMTPKRAHAAVCRLLDRLDNDQQRAAVLSSVAAVQQLSMGFTPKTEA